MLTLNFFFYLCTLISLYVIRNQIVENKNNICEKDISVMSICCAFCVS